MEKASSFFISMLWKLFNKINNFWFGKKLLAHFSQNFETFHVPFSPKRILPREKIHFSQGSNLSCGYHLVPFSIGKVLFSLWKLTPRNLVGPTLSPLLLERVAPHGTLLRLPLNLLIFATESPWQQVPWRSYPPVFFSFFFHTFDLWKKRRIWEKDWTLNLWVEEEDSNHYIIFFLEKVM
jgi:hypothetical protein